MASLEELLLDDTNANAL